MRRKVAVAVAAIGLGVGCTEHGSQPSDAASADDVALDDTSIDAQVVQNAGFVPPVAFVAAWSEPTAGTFQAEAVDLSCLHGVRIDPATTLSVTLAATVRDYQSNNLVPGSVVAAFPGAMTHNTFATTTADGGAVATLSMPSGLTRIGFQLTEPNARTTYVFDRLLAPSTAAQAIALSSVSTATATTLPALVSVTASASRTLELGTIVDCQGHSLSNVIATVSSTSGTATHLPGGETFYFSSSVDLPVRHSQATATTQNGRFMVVELPAATTAYVQMWGYRTADELAASTLILLAELPVEVPVGAAMLTRHDPRATH